MAPFHPQAEALNDILKQDCPAIYDLLSDKGKGIYFPKAGIIKQAAAAKGKKINATIGMAIEDDLTPMRLPSIESQINVDPAHAFTYASSYGKPELRQAWKDMITKKNPSLKSKYSLPIVTCALTHGLSIAGYLFVNEGDKIIVTDKFWGNYRLIFENAYGGKLTPFNTFKDGGFDLQSLEAALAGENQKQIVLLSLPNNPTGYTPTETEAVKFTEIIKASAERGNKIVILTDDAYFGLVFQDEVTKESLFAKCADLHENVLSVKIDGGTKEDYIWGFRVGFLTFACKGITDEVCAVLEDKTGGAIRGNISNAPHLSQSMLLNAFESKSYAREKAEKYNLLKSRFDAVQKVFEENGDKFSECFAPLPYNSGYFMCIQLKDNLNANDIRQILLDKYDTGLISIQNMLRIAFSSVSSAQIPVLFENIYKACKDSFQELALSS